MDWLANLNRALHYIEENLDEDIDLKEAAGWLVVRTIIFQECSPSLQALRYRSTSAGDA